MSAWTVRGGEADFQDVRLPLSFGGITIARKEGRGRRPFSSIFPTTTTDSSEGHRAGTGGQSLVPRWVGVGAVGLNAAIPSHFGVPNLEGAKE